MSDVVIYADGTVALSATVENDTVLVESKTDGRTIWKKCKDYK